MSRLCFLLLFPLMCIAQPESLVSDTKKLYEAFDTIDLDGIALMMCPSNPDEFAQGLDQWFQNEEFKFRYVFTNAKYNYLKVDESQYTITFRNVIRITYFGKIEPEEKREELRRQFTPHTLTFDPARNCFLIVYPAKMTARQVEGSWKFSFDDQTIPEHLKNYCQ